jgi:hypothetical protein
MSESTVEVNCQAHARDMLVLNGRESRGIGSRLFFAVDRGAGVSRIMCNSIFVTQPLLLTCTPALFATGSEGGTGEDDVILNDMGALGLEVSNAVQQDLGESATWPLSPASEVVRDTKRTVRISDRASLGGEAVRVC